MPINPIQQDAGDGVGTCCLAIYRKAWMVRRRYIKIDVHRRLMVLMTVWMRRIRWNWAEVVVID
jgi:hypothetical protein